MDEFHGHLGSQATKFSERVFSILDQNQSGNLDLKEFITGVWNYCTYDSKLVSKVKVDKGCALVALFFLALPTAILTNVMSITIDPT